MFQLAPRFALSSIKHCMKVTKQQKILGAVLLLGAALLTADRLFVLEKSEPAKPATASEYTLAGAAARTVASAPGPATNPSGSVAQRLRNAGQSVADKPAKDAFAPGAAWKQPVAETTKEVDNSNEIFKQSHRLTGVLTSSSGQAHAMVDGKIVAVGQIINGYRLVSISGRSATFESPLETRVDLNMAERSTAVAGAGQ
jgi:hypothetical protein